MSDRRFGISTHLFHDRRLGREELVHIAGHGFEAVEVFATRTHFDYHDAQAIEALAEWLSDTRLELHSLHAPAFETFSGGNPAGFLSIASSDETRRRRAVDETRAALALARRIPFRYLVLHLGVPAAKAAPGDNHPGAARRSVEDLAAAAADVGVQVALEVIPNDLSTPAALTDLLEEHLDGVNAGICLDYGHANLMGDVAEAIEGLSGHLLTTHVHDNRGRSDDHLVPFSGQVDWDVALMATQKIGYDGILMLEVAGTPDPLEVLRRSVAARERLDKLFVTF